MVSLRWLLTLCAHRRRAAISFSMYNNFLVVLRGVPSDGMPVESSTAKMGKKALNTRVTACLYGCQRQG